MAKLIYSAISSLDGYVADAEGNFDWSMPDEEVHRFVNALERPIGTYLYGRRLYEVMRYWDTAPTGNGEPSAEQEYAQIWQAAEKIIYSTSLESVSTARTRIERDFDPEAIERMKTTAAVDIAVGGATLAAQALRMGLVDECHFFLSPVVVGGGTAALPDNVRIDLELLDERRFGNGVVHLQYRIK
jgi:dihydrofolate reductase